MKPGEYVKLPSGATGKIVAVTENGRLAAVKLASGHQAGQVRTIRISRLVKT